MSETRRSKNATRGSKSAARGSKTAARGSKITARSKKSGGSPKGGILGQNPFTEREHRPSAEDIATVLDRTAPHWDALRAHIATDHAPVEEDWKYSGKSYGWALQLKQKRRAIIYLSPRERFFLAAFALGEQAAHVAGADTHLAPLRDVIATAPRYAEGRAVRFPIRTRADVGLARKLAAIKMAN